jgi:hypothetical protein
LPVFPKTEIRLFQIALSGAAHGCSGSVSLITSADDHADFEMLRALRAAPERDLAGLAAVLGVPRSNFGRRLDHHVLEQVNRLVDEGLVEPHGKRYRVSERGRNLLAERAFGDSP